MWILTQHYFGRTILCGGAKSRARLWALSCRTGVLQRNCLYAETFFESYKAGIDIDGIYILRCHSQGRTHTHTCACVCVCTSSWQSRAGSWWCHELWWLPLQVLLCLDSDGWNPWITWMPETCLWLWWFYEVGTLGGWPSSLIHEQLISVKITEGIAMSMVLFPYQ